MTGCGVRCAFGVAHRGQARNMNDRSEGPVADPMVTAELIATSRELIRRAADTAARALTLGDGTQRGLQADPARREDRRMVHFG